MELRDSGIEWIGQIPSHWEVGKLKQEFTYEKGKNAAVYTKDYLGLHKGIYPVYSGQTENDGIMGEIDTYDYDLSECVFSTTVGAKVMTPKYLQGKFSLSQNCLIMTQLKNYSCKMLFYVLHPLFDYEKQLIPSYMQPSLRFSDLNKYFIPFPSQSEQKAIADYLDGECGRIDSIIDKTKQIIEKLKEYKKSLITETVTKGLNPNTPMKDSGIEWIGQIPSHWEVKKHKRIMKKLKEICYKYSGQKIISLTMNGVIIRDLDNPMGKMPETFDGYQFVYTNNLLLCLFDIDVTPRCVGLIKDNGITSPAYSQFKLLESNQPNYYNYLLRSIDDKKSLLHLAKNLRSSLSETDFGAILTIVPPLSEQQAIADYLDEQCAKIDSVIEKREKMIDLLSEYKKSLIYECVTGKKEVA